MKKIFNKIVAMVANLSLLVGTLIPLATPAPAYAATNWNIGDVFVGVNSGTYQVYTNAGVLKDTVSDVAGGFTTGCVLDTAGNLYGTFFGANTVKKFDAASPHTSSTFGSGYSTPESIVFDAVGNVYVGNLGNGIRKYDSAGTFLATVIGVRVDWFDIAADQDTILYTQEGSDIKRVSISSGPLTDFTTGTATQAFALRILSDGGVLLADLGNVKRYDSTGALVGTYDVTGENTWFSLNLDPDGTSFWAGNFGTGKFYKYAIGAPGNYLDTQLLTVDSGVGSGDLFGICLKGEPTAAGEDTRRMTGGGTIPAGNPTLEGKHGFELHCDVTDLPNRLEVNWGKGNKFHLESLTSAVCVDDPLLDEGQPVAGFDTYKGKGTGRLNGVSGATAEWKFTDDGEPGVNDYATITITDGVNTYTFSGNLKNGNHQAHAQ